MFRKARYDWEFEPGPADLSDENEFVQLVDWARRDPAESSVAKAADEFLEKYPFDMYEALVCINIISQFDISAAYVRALKFEAMFGPIPQVKEWLARWEPSADVRVVRYHLTQGLRFVEPKRRAEFARVAEEIIGARVDGGFN
jgi:hypothetical protein